MFAVLLTALPASLAHAQDDDDDDVDDLGELDDLDDLDEADAEEQDDDGGVDDEGIYTDYKDELRGDSAAEELDAWRRYLDVYPRSVYRMEIEKRIDALKEAAFREIEEDDLDSDQTSPVDAKEQEMFLREPALIQMSANPRRHAKLHALWGFSDYLNYELSFEWAFMRKFSAFAELRHQGRGLGTQLQIGAKYALVKDVRTGVILTGAISLAVGYNDFDRLNLGVEPWVGFAWIASEKFQVQTSIAPYVRLDRPRLILSWDVQAVVSPIPVLGIYVESKQRHSFTSGDGIGTKYLGFHTAGVGVKIFPQPNFELTIGANVPYAWNIWKDYRYFGIHAGLAFYFDKKKT